MVKRDRGGSRTDDRRFVQVTRRPSTGVELSTGRMWIGIDQQVGHGSADALYELTDEQYPEALVDELDREFVERCWSGARDDLRLFGPAGGAWLPEHWLPSRARMLPPRFVGELWWHIDALGEPLDGELVEVSRGLAAGTARLEEGADGVRGMTFSLVGDGAYPRPAALIARLNAGSDRAAVASMLGDPMDADGDVHTVEGVLVRFGYVDGGLVEIGLELPASVPAPGGQLGVLLAALGEPETSAAVEAAARLSGDSSRRWAHGSGGARRLIAFDGGVDMQVEDDRVLSVRIALSRASGDSTYRHADELIPGVPLPASRAEIHAALGAPVDSSGGTDMHRYGRRDLLVEYGLSSRGEAPSSMTAVLSGVSVSTRFHRWRSGEFTTFLDILGREQSDALVARVRALDGVRLRMRGGVVSDVEIGGSGYQSQRFAAFIDGSPAEPTRTTFAFGSASQSGAHDDAWHFDQSWVHVHLSDDDVVERISVRQELPPGLELRAWTFQFRSEA